MSVISGIKNDPIGSAQKAQDVNSVADATVNAGIGALNSNKIETAKGLTSALLAVHGILTPVPGGSLTSDVASVGSIEQ